MNTGYTSIQVPHLAVISLLMSLINPCKIYFQGDILFALLVVSSALPELWRLLWVFYLWPCACVKHVIGWLILTYLLSPDFGNK